MASLKDIEKEKRIKREKLIAKRTIRICDIIFGLGLVPLFWFGVLKNSEYPNVIFWLLAYVVFLTCWYGKIAEDILFKWLWNIRGSEGSDEIGSY